MISFPKQKLYQFQKIFVFFFFLFFQIKAKLNDASLAIATKINGIISIKNLQTSI
mgnify:CR=1 FL=1